MTFHHTVLDHVRQGLEGKKKVILLTTGTTLAVVLLIVGGTFAYGKVYEGKIYPNVTVGGVELGGLTRDQAYEKLQDAYESMIKNGIKVELDGVENTPEKVITLRPDGSTDPDLVYELIQFNVDSATEQAFSAGRNGTTLEKAASSLMLLVQPERITPDLVFFEDQLRGEIQTAFGEYEVAGEKTDFDITISRSGDVNVGVTEGSSSKTLTIDETLDAIKNDALDFQISSTSIALKNKAPEVVAAEAEALEDEVNDVLQAAPYTLTYTSSRTGEEESWEIKNTDLSEWLIPEKKNGTVTLTLDTESMTEFWEDVRETVDVRAENARFQIEGDRVTEFKGSQDGVSLDEAATIEDIVLAFGDAESSIPVTITVVKPDIATENVNDLGIKDVLGVGISDFKGSPANRIQNIKHGASKLNGMLIAPGQTVSLVEELKPFTTADGYLPELVIKGDQIIPEIGGGLCQIGTTTFRAAMNSGLKIVERRNHSLVVNYYNDLSNGNPGTDATLYDPAPDFKFQNDTANYILLETNVNMDDMRLYFTFWGTDDGRNGSYIPPQILSWTGYGATQYKETTTLAPGVTKCQGAHPGAKTSFDYVVEYADGTTHTETFTSTYRSLPQICLVGKATSSESGDEGALETTE